MISAHLRRISTSEGDDLELYVPQDPQKFCVLVRAMVGPRGGVGEESFDINVCTPQWLEEQIAHDGFAFGTHRLFVQMYDPLQIKKLITKFIERYSGDSWREVAEKIGRFARWEFEDYKAASR
jgi:Immunity protein 8